MHFLVGRFFLLNKIWIEVFFPLLVQNKAPPTPKKITFAKIDQT